jgi:Ni/Co efflux regulator RcnB
MRAKFFSLFAICLFVSGAAFADEHGRKGRGHERGGEASESREDVSVAARFGDDDRRAVNEYYGSQGGKCPPGLAKKNNGCMPPGQAKKWERGHRLPPYIVYHEVPRDLVVRLPPLPVSQRYVRVAGDILLIAAGTGLVIDAIEDLGRL